MANPVKGEVAFEALGKRYVLSYSVNALCQLEEEIGESVIALSAKMQAGEGASIRMIRSIFRAGLLDNQGEITEKEAGDIMTEIGVAEASGLVEKAFALAFPDAPRGGSGRPLAAKPARNGTGRKSLPAG